MINPSGSAGHKSAHRNLIVPSQTFSTAETFADAASLGIAARSRAILSPGQALSNRKGQTNLFIVPGQTCQRSICLYVDGHYFNHFVNLLLIRKSFLGGIISSWDRDVGITIIFFIICDPCLSPWMQIEWNTSGQKSSGEARCANKRQQEAMTCVCSEAGMISDTAEL